MNRRTALMLSMLWGGLVPAKLWAQSQKRRSSNTREKTLEPSTPARRSRRVERRSRRTEPAGHRGWLSMAPLRHFTIHAASHQSVDTARKIDHRLDFQANRHHRVARREARGSVGQPHPDPRVQLTRRAQAGGRNRRTVRQRDRRRALDSHPVHGGRRHPLALYRLPPAHARRQRSPGPADLDDASGGCRHRAVEYADSTGLPQAGRSKDRDDQRSDPHDPDPRGTQLRRRPSARERRGIGFPASR